MIYFWFWMGIALVISEFILPGLVAVFVGLGSLTVAAAIHFSLIDGLIAQVCLWFASSLFYLLTLRLLIMHFYPSDVDKKEIISDMDYLGKEAEVIEDIPINGSGRVLFSQSTWAARTEEKERINKGEKVVITARENLTLVVKK